MSKLNTKQHIAVELKMDEINLTVTEEKATYQEIKDYVLVQSGLKVSSLYIAQVKQKCRIMERAIEIFKDRIQGRFFDVIEELLNDPKL